MSTTRRHDSDAPRALRAVLDDIERILQDDARRRAERSDVPGCADRLEGLASELDAAVAADPAEAARRARRLRDIRARMALHARAIPSGALDGLYQDVTAATDDASPWARSRMSDAFLDAPQQLVRWRSTALAACALLALGAGLFAGGRLGIDGGFEGQSSVDPRHGLLAPLEGATATDLPARPGTSRLVSDPGPRVRTGRTPSLFLFYDNGRRRAADAKRRLDAVPIRIFPVGAPADDVEKN